MSGVHPDQAREAVRNRTYANRTEEDVTVRAVDNQLFDAARTFEQFVAESALDLHVHNGVLVTAAGDMAQAIRDFRYEVEEGTAPADQRTAKRWQELRQQAEDLSADLARADANAEFAITRAEAPWEAWVETVEKYPALLPDLYM